MNSFQNIKLIIWDLDNTFWSGILSEGPIVPVPENIALIKILTDHGIVNSICSKNDLNQTERKLEELGINDLFVFKSINWEPKGQRISKLIHDMGLRPVNCLFIDDNIVNLKEAQYYEKDLMIAEPDVIPELFKFFNSVPANDKKHKRLNNYKILEQKTLAKEASSDNLAFLFDSDTHVEIHHDCVQHIDRIYELVSRTNQLNYTKVRSKQEDLESLCQDSSVKTGYVTVCDKYGDYGIVGFYALKAGQLIHFLFSCRTIGQGVEQYVYAYLNYPILNVVGEVVNLVNNEPKPAWINQPPKNETDDTSNKSHKKIIIKGACDLKVMSQYLNTENVIEEFTYTGIEKGNWIEHQNHSVNYLQWHFLPPTTKTELLDECIFNDKEMFKTSIYDQDVSIIFLSTMIEPNLGIYRRKKDGLKIAFGEYLYPLTDSNFWDLYTNNKIFTAQNHFTLEWIKKFCEKYEFEGRLSSDQIISNIKELLQKTNSQTKLCYILGSEIPFEKNKQDNYQGRHLIYKEINDKIRKLAKENNRILLIDVNEFIHGQEDFTNNINHFHRRIYYELATKANEYITEVTGNKLKQKSRLFLYRKDVIDRIGYTGFYQTKFWHYLRIPIKFLIRTFRL